MRTLTAVAAAVLAVAPFAAAAAGKPARCRGTLSGDVRGSFACSALLGTKEGGALAFVIAAPGPVEGVPSVVPGAFELPAPVAVRTYTLEDLGMGKASVAAEGGALYTAAKTSSRRGEVTLTLTSLRKSRSVAGAYEVHGSYRARLVPVGGGRTGDVVVEVRF